MRVLVTGQSGFVGGHLVQALMDHGSHEIHGLSRAEGGTLPSVVSHVVDLLDVEKVTEVVREVRPEWVFHLAGYAHGGRSFREPDAAWDGNLTATRRLYQAIHEAGMSPRVLFVSTGLVYGDPQGDSDLCDEDTPMAPTSPYAASKAAADLLSFQVTRDPGLNVVRVRPFNHIGPGQSAEYAIANFARQLTEIERGERPALLETGDLSSARDFTDVRDMVRAYIRLMEVGHTSEAYNAASGRTVVVQDVLDRMIELSGLSVEVRQRVYPTRRADVRVSRADITRLTSQTGWRPELTLDQSLEAILHWWRYVGSNGSTNQAVR